MQKRPLGPRIVAAPLADEAEHPPAFGAPGLFADGPKCRPLGVFHTEQLQRRQRVGCPRRRMVRAGECRCPVALAGIRNHAQSSECIPTDEPSARVVGREPMDPVTDLDRFFGSAVMHGILGVVQQGLDAVLLVGAHGVPPSSMATFRVMR